MAKYTAMALKAGFIIMGCITSAAVIYTVVTDGLPFRKDLLTPWMTATLVDFYINVTVFAVWVCYKESSWIAAALWVILLVCFGSITTCLYITIQLFLLTAKESEDDPMYHILLRHQNRKDVGKRSSCQIITARIAFSVLGCLMSGVLLYTILTDGSPFRKDIITPWLTTTLIDFYINVAALSVWIGYKESSWIMAFIWIVLLICSGSIATCAYIVRYLLLLSPDDPLELVLLNSHHRVPGV
ncbi:uncharacterized protein LOC141586909 isoform X2 [Silene latifolia]|uniref:uncharacterized protein LOC141586909 isoform X2 n=1 Tax=Silene latifolia TaxID=37657 RepID=UPI003D779200